MSQVGFYNEDAGQVLFATTLDTPSGHYEVANHASYSYPIDGQWYYFETKLEAVLYFGVNPGMDGSDKSDLMNIYGNLQTNSAKIKLLRIVNEFPEIVDNTVE